MGRARVVGIGLFIGSLAGAWGSRVHLDTGAPADAGVGADAAVAADAAVDRCSAECDDGVVCGDHRWDVETNGARDIAVDPDGNLYVSTADGVLALSGEGSRRWEQSFAGCSPLGIVHGNASMT